MQWRVTRGVGRAWTRWLVLLAPCALLCAAPASAQPQVEPAGAAGTAVTSAAPAPAEPTEYRALVDAAVSEYERGNWTEAYALFAQAHALEPSARTLRGLAISAFEGKQYLRAIGFMRSALGDQRKPLPDEQRSEANGLIARAEVFLARVHVVMEPAAARIEVDAAPAVRDAEGRVLLDPGSHQLTFTHAGYVTENRAVRVSPSDALDLVIELASAAPAEPARAPLSIDTSLARADSSGSALRPWAWVSAVGSVAFVGAGVTMFAVGQDGLGDVESACPEKACSSAQIDRLIDRKHLKLLQAGSISAFVIAGVSAVTSIVLFVSDDDERAEPPTALAPLRARF